MERGAGAGALIPDAQYEEAGAKLVDDAWSADVVVKVAPPSAEEIVRLGASSVLIGFLQPLTNGGGDPGDRRNGRDQLRARVGATDQPRAVDGCALEPGEHRRLQGGADRRDRRSAVSSRC